MVVMSMSIVKAGTLLDVLVADKKSVASTEKSQDWPSFSLAPPLTFGWQRTKVLKTAGRMLRMEGVSEVNFVAATLPTLVLLLPSASKATKSKLEVDEVDMSLPSPVDGVFSLSSAVDPQTVMKRLGEYVNLCDNVVEKYMDCTKLKIIGDVQLFASGLLAPVNASNDTTNNPLLERNDVNSTDSDDEPGQNHLSSAHLAIALSTVIESHFDGAKISAGRRHGRCDWQ